MKDTDFDTAPPGEPDRDAELGAMLRAAEADLMADDLAVARQRQRIAVAIRQTRAARPVAAQAPSLWDWIARAARPVPIGIAAALFIAAVSVLQFTPVQDQIIATDTATVSSDLLSPSTSSDIMNALIPPTSRDSLLARALGVPVAVNGEAR